MSSAIFTLDAARVASGTIDGHELTARLENGEVLYLPNAAFGAGFAVERAERRFLDPRWAHPKAKNISFDPENRQLGGAVGNTSDLGELRELLQRYHRQSLELVTRLFPSYAGRMRLARASLRTLAVEGRRSSWRKDDSRLHVDAFPSRPNAGERILRVFANVNPAGVPRVWRVGEPFPDLAHRYLAKIPRQMPGSAALMKALGITRTLRTEYDHIMLRLHDTMKADARYQREAPQETMPFPGGCMWICYSDQVSHAVMAGQHMLEQTVHLDVASQLDPQYSPLRVLERLSGRKLV